MLSTPTYAQHPKYSKSTLWQIQKLRPDINNAQNTANPLFGRSTHYIQFTQTRVQDKMYVTQNCSSFSAPTLHSALWPDLFNPTYTGDYRKL